MPGQCLVNALIIIAVQLVALRHARL